MNTRSRISIRWTSVAAGAAMLLGLGAAGTYLVLRLTNPSTPVPAQTHAGPRDSGAAVDSDAPPAPSPQSVPDGASREVVVVLDEEAVRRAGITTEQAIPAQAPGATLRAPGVVEPNGYRTVVVTPLAGGRVTEVTAELGASVRQGQSMARVFSPELAQAQTRYLSDRAALDAHDRELARTEALVKIGAASREELERVHAEHTARRADVQAASSRLELLGMSRVAIDGLDPGGPVASVIDVPAPIDGIIVERVANVGLNVDQSAKLFSVVDLSTVWVVSEVYERDFSQVRVGGHATVSFAAYPDLVLRGRVSYIDPQVNRETRTAKVRIEVPNTAQRLRLGMYADVSFDGAAATTPSVPRRAVQQVGDATVVYLVDGKQPGRFIERQVRLGAASGERVAVLAGLEAGDVVVVEGSFHVRAERERLGLGARSETAGQSARITISEQGFEPARFTLRAGIPARLTFVRITDKTCATEVVFPSLGIRRALPLNEPVTIELTPRPAGELAFACGMNMLKGTVVVVDS